MPLPKIWPNKSFHRHVDGVPFILTIMSNILACFQPKRNDSILRKCLVHFGPFCPSLGQQELCRKIKLCDFSCILDQLNPKYRKN